VKETLLKKIENQQFVVGVVGLGYVALAGGQVAFDILIR